MGAGVVVAPAAPAAVPRGQSWFDFKLIVKLIFLVFILCQSSTLSHTILMGGIAAVVYLQQVGIVRYILESIGVVGVAGGGEGGGGGANVVPGAAGVGVGGGVGAAAPAGAGQDNNAVALVPQVPDVPIGNIPHATTGGFMTDICTFFMGLFLSLVPSWTPVAQQPQLLPLVDDAAGVQPGQGGPPNPPPPQLVQ